MTVPLRTVAVVGLGLIGGSLCRALREAIPSLTLVGIDPDPQAADRARESGVCDRAGSSPDLLAGTEAVVVCAPLDTIPAWVRRCSERAPSALVTDCGSTKAWIADQVRSVPRVRYVGGHPMAGRELGGWDQSDARLFAGCTWVLTSESGSAEADFEPWVDALDAIGAHVAWMTPLEHDQAVAWSSHLPLALSSALVNAVAASSKWPDAGRLTAGGFRDAARLAGGDPRLHAWIATTNSSALGEAIDGLIAELTRLRGVLGDEKALIAFFELARETRRQWLADRATAGRPVR